MQGNTNVRFTIPEYVSPTEDAFDGCDVAVEYDSNYNDDGETVTVSGIATIDEARHAREWTTLVVDGKHIRPNGHVFSGKDGRHIGTVEEVSVVVDAEVAIELATDSVDHDVDRGDSEIIVQTWDESIIGTDGFMAGTDEIRMARVC